MLMSNVATYLWNSSPCHAPCHTPRSFCDGNHYSFRRFSVATQQLRRQSFPFSKRIYTQMQACCQLLARKCTPAAFSSKSQRYMVYSWILIFLHAYQEVLPFVLRVVRCQSRPSVSSCYVRQPFTFKIHTPLPPIVPLRNFQHGIPPRHFEYREANIRSASTAPTSHPPTRVYLVAKAAYRPRQAERAGKPNACRHLGKSRSRQQ